MPGYARALRDIYMNQGKRNANPVSEVLSVRGGILPVPGSVAPSDIERQIKRYYERVVWVFRCVDVIASNFADLQFVFRVGDTYDGRVMQYAQIANVINVEPNDYEQAWQWKYRLMSQVLLSDRGVYLEPVYNGTNLQAIHLLPPGSVEPIPDENTFVSGYRVRLADQSYTFKKKHELLWIRCKPHPTDPYTSVTPLKSAGIIADSDFLARTFNRNFLLNDGRPATIITIGDQISPDDAAEIKARFSNGPVAAGTTTVIEGSDVQVQDLSGNPRDAQYTELISTNKQDIMLAFGVPESVMGNASGRTYDNADAEDEFFWTKTEVPYALGCARGLQPLLGSPLRNGNIHMGIDFSKIEVLQRQTQARHEKQANEVAGGLDNIDAYRIATGKKPYNVPATRALILPNGLLIGQDEADQAALDKMVPIGGRAMPQPGSQFIPGQTLNAQVEQAQQNSGAPVGPPQITNNSPAAITSGPSTSSTQITGTGSSKAEALRAVQGEFAKRDRANGNNTAARALRLIRGGRQSKSAGRNKAIEGKGADDPKPHPYGPLRAVVEGTLNGVLLAWCDQQADVIPGRLTMTKARQHTRHWDGITVVTKALDPQYVVQINRWSDDLLRDMSKVLEPIAKREVLKAARDMDGGGITQIMFRHSLGNPHGTDALSRVFSSKSDVDTSLMGTLNPLYDVIRQAAANQSQRVAAKVQDMDQQGASITQIQRAITQMIGKRSNWRNQLATFLTTAVVEGAQEAAYSRAGDIMQKEWNTELDESVRPTHKKVEGDVVLGGQDFIVGGAHMPYPGYPLAPISETANCFPAGTMVTGLVDGAYRREYSGDMVEVVTREGKKLTGTPNHPVLTDKGWVPLQLLMEGDYLVSYSNNIQSAIGHHVQGRPAGDIAQVFDTLAMSQDLVRISRGGVNFHGELPEGDVDVVLIDRALQRYTMTPADEFVRKFFLPTPNQASVALVGVGAPSFSQAPVGAATPGFVSSLSQPATFGGGTVSHSREHGLTSITRLNTMLGKEGSDGTTSDASFISKGLLGYSGKVLLDDVVRVRRIEGWSGHVYNLSTKTGAYTSNGIIVHNCRCWVARDIAHGAEREFDTYADIPVAVSGGE